jgi:hypothetical protein
MAADLDEIVERLDYCDTEIAATRSACHTYIQSAFEWRAVKLPNQSIIIQTRLTKPLPTAIKARTGTTIHEIRSCLDALACQLAIRNGKSPTAYFPISKNAEVFEKDGIKKIKKLSQADQDAIIFMQPHGKADPFLFGIHEFDRVRKHRRLGVSLPKNNGVGFGDCEITSLIFHGVAEMKDQWAPAFTMGPGSWANFAFKNEIIFIEPTELAGLNILTGMQRFLAQTRGIVGAFQ